MKKRFAFPTLMTLFIGSSCSIKGSFHGLYSYRDRTEVASPGLIQTPMVPICELRSGDQALVYAVSGDALKRCLASVEKAVVYIWQPRCSSEQCVSLNAAQAYCDQKGIALFVVSEYYDSVLMGLRYDLERPVLGIDTHYYQSDLTRQYLGRFTADLLTPEPTTLRLSRFNLFEYGCLVKAVDRIQMI